MEARRSEDVFELFVEKHLAWIDRKGVEERTKKHTGIHESMLEEIKGVWFPVPKSSATRGIDDAFSKVLFQE